MDERVTPKIEVEVRPQGGGNLGALTPKLESLTDRLDEITSTLKFLSNRIGKQLAEGSVQSSDAGYSVEEIELKLSLDLESEVGVVVARGTARAGFEATLKWKLR